MNRQAIAKTKLRKGDLVMVISGRERGKTGKVLSIDLKRGKISVEKLNIIKRHTRPTQKNRQGGILEREAPLAISNVMYFSTNQQQPVRLGVKTMEDQRRVRVTRKHNEVLE